MPALEKLRILRSSRFIGSRSEVSQLTQRRLRTAVVLFSLTLLTLPLVIAHGAGARIEGKVSDPKGAIIVGATVIVTDPLTSQTFTAVTDQQGHYKIEGLPPGTYSVTVSAKGFSDARSENVKVEEGAAAIVDVKLEIAPVEAAVTVAAPGPRANADPVYQQLRQTGKSEADFAGAFASVNNLILQRDAAIFTLRSGEIYFGATVQGRVTAAVFIGDGEMSLTPPTPIEKHSLSIFIDDEKLDEQFSHLVIRFTDKTFEQIKASPRATMGTGGPQSSKARDLYRENQQLLRKELRDNAELRTLADIYAPQRPGYFTAFIAGKKHGKLVFLLDPLGIPQVSPEEVALFSYGETDGGIWTAFHLADEYAKRTAASSEDHRLFDITHHEIDAVIHGTHITANDRITIRVLVAGRVLPFNLFPSLRVSRVQDSQGGDLEFIQEGKDEDAELGVITPNPLEVGQDYSVTVQYSGGDAIRDAGAGNFILISRLTWYPNNRGTQFGDRAIFDMTFHYPKGNTFIATGELAEPETREGDSTVSKWTSGKLELAVAGFNYGRFKKKEVLDEDTGYKIEFYANEDLPSAVEGRGIGMVTTTGMANSALADAQNATRIYSAYFGKMPYKRLAITQQPAGFFGQAWPTLIYMPFTAFLDSTERHFMLGAAGADNFFRYVGAHEVSHQWWGHTIGWDSYHDQWMSEGFAEFSTSLYVQFVRKDLKKFNDFWNDQRDLITQSRPQTHDKKPYLIGPVTQGYRLNSGKTGNIARFMIYPKGAYILHMIRMMFHGGRDGDKQFQELMKDFVQTYFNRDVSTEDFKLIVEKHMTREMDLDDNGRMDWFFNEWVYGTEMPNYRFEYQLGADGMSISGRITQSGVSDNFKMLVPVYVDFGNGWAKIGAARMTGNTSVDLRDIRLPQTAKRAAICALNDVLALNIQNAK